MPTNNIPPVLHLWSPEYFHSEGYVVGNYEGLIRLRNVIDNAITNGFSMDSVYIGDGEGYNLYVFRFDNIMHAAVPYRDDIAAEQRERAIYPWDMVKRK